METEGLYPPPLYMAIPCLFCLTGDPIGNRPFCFTGFTTSTIVHLRSLFGPFYINSSPAGFMSGQDTFNAGHALVTSSHSHRATHPRLSLYKSKPSLGGPPLLIKTTELAIRPSTSRPVGYTGHFLLLMPVECELVLPLFLPHALGLHWLQIQKNKRERERRTSCLGYKTASHLWISDS